MDRDGASGQPGIGKYPGIRMKCGRRIRDREPREQKTGRGVRRPSPLPVARLHNPDVCVVLPDPVEVALDLDYQRDCLTLQGVSEDEVESAFRLDISV